MLVSHLSRSGSSHQQKEYTRDDDGATYRLKYTHIVSSRFTRRSGCRERPLWRLCQIEGDTRSVDSARQQADGWYQHVTDQGEDDFPECPSPHDTDRHIVHIVLHGEVFELVQQAPLFIQHEDVHVGAAAILH